MTTYLTVAIPYVNAHPHLGYAYELIEADLAARARRSLGEPVRFLGGTDDYSLKNVLAAEAVGETTRAFVDRHADRFEALAQPLRISFDDFIRTSRDQRHRPAVERLWRACADRGDLYQRDYTGSYCVGCEQYYDPDELVGGRCAEHGDSIDTVSERNWFFRLSSYTEQLLDLIETGTIRITPDPFRAEIVAFLRGGLDDISVSRSAARARGWGIPVPGDAGQVVYVWFDALTNYVSALDYGTDGESFERWWRRADERIHVVGKGITRFHAVYWPAFLLSAGEPPPTRIHVHPYLSIDGAKISKSSGAQPSPTALTDAYGTDTLRWWIASDVSATSDTDFTVERLVTRANETLANGLGNAVNRVATLRHRLGRSIAPPFAAEPLDAAQNLPEEVATALADFDRRGAVERIVATLDSLNRRIEADEPWTLLRRPDQPDQADGADRLEALLAVYLATLELVARAVEPIAPDVAARVTEAIVADARTRPSPIFGRLAAPE